MWSESIYFFDPETLVHCTIDDYIRYMQSNLFAIFQHTIMFVLSVHILCHCWVFLHISQPNYATFIHTVSLHTIYAIKTIVWKYFDQRIWFCKSFHKYLVWLHKANPWKRGSPKCQRWADGQIITGECHHHLLGIFPHYIFQRNQGH